MGDVQFVYAIVADEKYVKVGTTKAPLQRLELLQNACPHKLHFYAVVEGPIALERRLHRVLASEACEGGREWFNWTDATRAQIDRWLGGAIAPSAMDAAAVTAFASRETQRETLSPSSYSRGLKACSACKKQKPRILFPRKADRSYSPRCSQCKAEGVRAKPSKRRRNREALERLLYGLPPGEAPL